MNVEKVVGVLTGVMEHLFRKWSLPPVGKLILFVGDNSTELKQKVRQPRGLQSQNSCGLPCVKHVNNIDGEVPLKPLDVVVASVEDLENVGIGEQGL